MTKILLLSDNHSYLDDRILYYAQQADEIWHAGDFGIDVAEKLQSIKPLKGVYGNIDNQQIRNAYPEFSTFFCEISSTFSTTLSGKRTLIFFKFDFIFISIY